MARVKYGAHTYGEINIIGRGGKVRVGKFCSIAGGVKAVLAEHRHDWVTTFPFCDRSKLNVWPEAAGIVGQPHTKGPLAIGNDVWIGYGAMFLGGVTVGDGAVIGAGAVVTRDIPAYAIAAGNPARMVRLRFDECRVRQLLDIAWWDWPEEKIRKNIWLLCSSSMDSFIDLHWRPRYRRWA